MLSLFHLPSGLLPCLWVVNKCFVYLFISLASAGVVLRCYSWDPEGGDRVSDVVPTPRGSWPHQGGAPPPEGNVLVHRGDRPAVHHRVRSGHAAEELLLWQEEFGGGLHLELLNIWRFICIRNKHKVVFVLFFIDDLKGWFPSMCSHLVFNKH